MPVDGAFTLFLRVFLKSEINFNKNLLTCLKRLIRQKLHQWFLSSSRRVLCGNRVKVSSITSSGESIKPDLHKEGPGLDTRWALFSSHLIRGVGHSNSTPMPSGWLCPALLSFLPIHNGEPPSSNPNLLTPMTPSPQCTIDTVHPPALNPTS